LSFIGKFIGDIIEVIRRQRNRQFEFRVCIMKEGVNTWETMLSNSLTWKYSDSYEVEPKCLYELERNPGLRISQWFERIKNSFIVIFKEDNPQGVVFTDPDRSAYTLKVVQESRALGMALKEEFKQVMSFKRIFILVILAIVIGVVYMVVTGQLSI